MLEKMPEQQVLEEVKIVESIKFQRRALLGSQ